MRLVAAVLSVIIPAALVACGDSTGPEPPFSISLSIESSAGPTFVDLDTLAQLECDLTLRAIAHGPGTATWGDGKFYVYFGPDRATPRDSGTIPAATVQQSWGASTIDSTQTRSAQWRLSASIPFDVVFAFAYSKNNGPVTHTSPLKFTCGPAVPAGTSPPKFSSFATKPASGEIQGGDTLTVSYAVGSTIGMWESRIELDGACTMSRVFPEHLVHAATRSVPIVIPAECVPGTPLNVSVRAFDAAGQGVQTQGTTLALVDRKPPRASVFVDWLYQSPLGQYVLGSDSLLVSIGGSDNHALHALFWTLAPGGAVDSLLTGLPFFGRQVTVPVPDSSPRKIVMRAWSRDAVGLVSDTVVAPPDSVRVVPLRNRLIRMTAVLPDVGAITVAERRGMVYAVAPYPQPMILGISLQTMAVIDTISLPSGATDVDVTPGGDSLVVTLLGERAVGIIDLTVSPRTVALLPLSSMAAGNFPSRVRTLANGAAFVTVAGNDPATQTLLELDLRTGVDRVRTDAGANGVVGAAALERSYDHRVVAVDVRINNTAGLQRYDLGTDAFGSIVTHAAWFEPAVDGTGAHIALGATVYDAALNVQRVCESPAAGRGIFPVALSFDGTTLYHAMSPFGLLRDSVINGQLVERTRLPFAPYLFLASADSKMAIAFDKQHYKIAVIDLQ